MSCPSFIRCAIRCTYQKYVRVEALRRPMMDWTDVQIDGFQRAQHTLRFGQRIAAVYRLDREAHCGAESVEQLCVHSITSMAESFFDNPGRRYETGIDMLRAESELSTTVEELA